MLSTLFPKSKAWVLLLQEGRGWCIGKMKTQKREERGGREEERRR